MNKETLFQCCGSRAWVEGMWERQPFASREALVVAADEVWWTLTEADWLEAFSHHPRIGDPATLLARLEQAGVVGADEAVLTALAAGNRRYEEKNGFVFLICATGKTAAEMLSVLEARLRNDRLAELNIAAGEQVKIMKLRLERMGL